MSWLKKLFRRVEPEDEIVRREILISTILRWHLYDLGVDTPNEVAVSLGLNPVSDEGEEKELEDSEVRLQEVTYFLPFLKIIAKINAEVVASVQLRSMEDSDLADKFEEEIEHIIEFYTDISTSCLISAFASGIELGIIQPSTLGIGAIYEEKNEY